ncbi:MAG: T9SS type A sorting domain-containing protein [Lewinellaceae bacterium]|nr:T9SS type A sorting domain-containing protein [Lewinellaceae bacterium]
MKKTFYSRIIIIPLLVQILSVSVTPGQDFTYSLGNRDALINEAAVPVFPWFPDGHIPVLAEPDNEKHIMYWPEYENYRTLGDFPFPEYQYTLSPQEPVFGGRLGIERWDNGGSWLMSVFRQEGDILVGFYHAEDHWVVATNPEGIAWKSIARTTSNDNGVSWAEGAQIITSSVPRPEDPAWGGTGDNCVIWDDENQRWICYYQEHWLMMAVSYDVEGNPGTWFKYYNGGFDQPGLGGANSPIPGLQSVPGGNPSVHYNSYLEKFVMVWHSWVSTSIYISTSTDGIAWEQPRLLEPNSGTGRRAWYPTIIGSSDTEAGKIARLYYADIAPGFASRDFVSKALVFDKEEEYQPQTAWQHQRIGAVPILGLMDSTTDNKLRIVSFDGSIENTENIEYYFKNKEGSYVVSGKFQLDDLYGEGSVGLSVRSGLNDGDVMAAIVLSADRVTFLSRETAGDLNFSGVNSIEWTSDIVWFQIEKSSGALTCRYSSDGEEWADIGSIPFGFSHSKLGLFATGNPDTGTIAYIENFEGPDLPATTQGSLEDGSGSVYSNPSGNQVFITNPEYYTHFSIYGLNGKIQLFGSINGNQIDVQKLRPGLYVLSLHGRNNERTVVEKLVIMR